MVTRATLHGLVDDLPDAALEAAGRSLLLLRDDPVLQAFLTAPEDDEALSLEEASMLDERLARYRAGDFVSMDEVKRMLAH